MSKGFTQPDWLMSAAREAPTSPALITDARTWTYAELDAWAGELAAGLAADGVARGDRIGVRMANSPAYAALVWAVWRLGAAVVPLNTRLTAAELAYQEAAAGCARVMTDAPTTDAHDEAQGTQADRGDALARRVAGLEFTRQDIAAILFTSGTSGRPKGAQLTFNNFYYAAMASTLRLGNLPGDRWLLTLPLYHIGGLSMLVRACLCRVPVIVLDRFEPEVLIDLIQRHQATLVSLVPTMLFRLLTTRTSDPVLPACVRMVLVGGAAASPELLVRAARRGVPAATSYGLTEACSQVCTALPEVAQAKPGTVGRPLPFMRVRIADADGQALPPGAVGEIVVQGPNVMFGYVGETPPHIPLTQWGTPERLPYQAGFATGDLGYLDDAGDLFVVARRSDLIVSGGENIYPAEVEEALRAHPGVADVCVVGVDDAEWGQIVAAVVVAEADSMQMPEAAHDLFRMLQAHARSRLAGYKLPRRWRLVDALPQTATGKVDRQAVRALITRTDDARS
jgi:O-succinylbenzoic acid--CoA ligase